MVEVLAVCIVLVDVYMVLWWISGDGMVDLVVMVVIVSDWLVHSVVLENMDFTGICCCSIVVDVVVLKWVFFLYVVELAQSV